MSNLYRATLVATLIFLFTNSYLSACAQPETSPPEVVAFLKELKRSLQDHRYEKAFKRSELIKSSDFTNEVYGRLTCAALADRTGRYDFSRKILNAVVNESAESRDSTGAWRPRWQVYRMIRQPMLMNDAAEKGLAVTAVFLSEQALDVYEDSDNFQCAELHTELASACMQNREYKRSIKVYQKALSLVDSEDPKSKKQIEFLYAQNHALATALSQTGQCKAAKVFYHRNFINAMNSRNAYESLDSLHELVNCLVQIRGKRDDYDEIIDLFAETARTSKDWVTSVLDYSGYLSIEHCDAPLNGLSHRIKTKLSDIRCRVRAEILILNHPADI
jgi:tetratricopeptide (TPR) repeat protein